MNDLDIGKLSLNLAGVVNSSFNTSFTGITKMKGYENSGVGSNGKIYLNWYGNQYVQVTQFKTVVKGTSVLVYVMSGANIFYTYYQEGEIGIKTQTEIAGVAGAIAGGLLGCEVGAWIGAGFGGLGAVPGAALGFIWGMAGSYFGGKGAEFLYKEYIIK